MVSGKRNGGAGKTLPQGPGGKKPEISVAATLLRTASLIVLTLAFMAVFRFFGPAIHAMQQVAGTGAWQSLYVLFHINSGLGREQLLLTAIMLFCFLLALIVQLAALWVWQRVRVRHEG